MIVSAGTGVSSNRLLDGKTTAGLKLMDGKTGPDSNLDITVIDAKRNERSREQAGWIPGAVEVGCQA
jgi:hypothetical protein